MSDSMFDELLRMRDQQRTKYETGQVVVEGDELPWESSSLGIVQWYAHPSHDDRVIDSFLVYKLRLLPGERGARLRMQGDEVLLATQGDGKTVVDGEELHWAAGDVLGLPVREGGLVVQHFNDSEETAEILSVLPNLIATLGVDQGVEFEVLEAASTFDSKDSK